jgi:Uncharacterised protein family (UPF0158)
VARFEDRGGRSLERLRERGGRAGSGDAGASGNRPDSAHEAYADMQGFVERVRDPCARDLLGRAIAGRGAFRRFKDALLDFPELRDAWFRFRDTRLEHRAIRWLVDERLVDEAAAERALAERPEPDLRELLLAFDPEEIARDVAWDCGGFTAIG